MNWRQLDGFGLHDDESEIESWIRISSKYFDFKDAGIPFMKYGLSMDNVRDIIHAYFGLEPYESFDISDFSNLLKSDTEMQQDELLNSKKPLTLNEVQKKYNLTKDQFNNVIEHVIKNLEGFLEEPKRGFFRISVEADVAVTENFLEAIKKKK